MGPRRILIGLAMALVLGSAMVLALRRGAVNRSAPSTAKIVPGPRALPPSVGEAEVPPGVPETRSHGAPPPTSNRVVDVRTFGAKGDGVTDDTAAIQRGVDAVAGSGGTLRIPRGIYLVNALAQGRCGIRLGSNLTLRLEEGAVLKVIPNASPMYILLLASGVSHVNIVGSGILEGDLGSHQGTEGEGGYCLQVSNGAKHIAVEGITARNAWGDGFYIDEATEVTFSHVQADHNRRQGMSIVGADQLIVENSRFTRTTGYIIDGTFYSGLGLDIEPYEGRTVSRVTITGCTLSENQGGGLNASVAGAHARTAHVSDVVIDRNTLARNGSVDNPHPGIQISGNTLRQRISNNRVEGNASIGIYVRSGASEVHITGNQVIGTLASPKARDRVDRPGYGILLSDVGGNTVSGNGGFGNAGPGVFELYPRGSNVLGENQVAGGH